MKFKHAWGQGNVLALALMALVPAVHAQPAKAAPVPDHADQFITLTTENDKYFGNTDRHYTNGARIEYTKVHNTTPGWVNKAESILPVLNTDGKIATTYSINHAIFTPDNIDRNIPHTGDVPFTGYLFGTAGFTNMPANGVWDTYGLTIGTIGPSAQGEFAQQSFHEAFDFYKPIGWDSGYGLSDEPIVNFSYLRRYRNTVELDCKCFGQDWFVELEPRYGFALGNAYTYLTTGATLRFGPAGAKGQDEVAYMLPGMPGTGVFTKAPNFLTWYGFIGIDGRLVGRNIFLDGNTFQSSPSLDKKYVVANGTAGLALTAGKYRATVSINQATKEYNGQPEDDVYGQLTLGYRF